MKEIKIVIKLTVTANDKDEDLITEAVHQELMSQMEDNSLDFSYKVMEEEEDEEGMEECDL
jgi:hypothetical protein